ncbi:MULTISPECIES: chromosome segregation protein SMC [Enterococcus]|uniref:chromosome segregation protein SMC n=1 Tax=Enterococcus TaxID=1350 RepID=UPI0006B1D609|nr:chromosome segregation protein SMC [Enterococcus hirae]AND71416.1 chromosome segregation protein SMC [Enterococcus hirae]MBA5271159.1 chromosome segregation protein SMC [Enterococcus hirae]MBE8787435.1 chromosome segregation protein SMC [Enterococcus hirae]MBE8805940.1 chromosome segregation protein SMC [Enterococcus hirae]MBO1088371.1 chromosome segregation protein SMC [Enterococcus hirae]
MYLKRIEIAGFKSFADKTVIDFENSVTAVVGPNGSGKSNITEAIRWVLGEQSAKSLRGGKMPDIIFAGSDSRKPLNVAEVTVLLDNTDHYLPLDYQEISVTRRYRRTGESDFFINKQPCRLKDIQELFLDSGLGKESFSIISQGKVEAIFSSKPEDRRGIFEEAAGVLKYKQRKKKAEQKLFETEDNLSRVQDIIYELQEQLTPLAEQSEIAKKFLQLKEELTQTDIALMITEINVAKKEWEEKQTQLTQFNQELTKLATHIQSQEAVLSEKRKQNAKKDRQIEKGQQSLLALSERLKQAEGQKDVLIERTKHTQKSTQEYQASLAEAQKKVAHFEELQEKLTKETTEKETEIQEAQQQLMKTQQELEKYQKSTKELLSELRDQYVDLMQEQANVGNELKYLERQYLQETSKSKQTLAKQSEVEASVLALSSQKQELSEKQANLQQALVKNQHELEEVQTKGKTVQTKLTNEQPKMYQLMNQVQQLKARQKSLQEIQENYFGFYQGVRLVLQHKQQLSGIVGAVAELIDVPSSFTLAIETALGGAAQHVIVENEHDARQAITYLKKQRGGRATFLPLTTIKPRQLPAHVLSQAAAVDGFLGIASEQVTFPAEIQTVVHNLLGTILLAKDLTSANAIAQTIRYQYRVVSLEGDVMNAGGSMTGGANKRGNQGSLFSQNQELKQLTAEYEQADQQLQNQEKIVQELQTKVADLSQKQEKLRTQNEQLRFEEQEITNQLQNITNDLARFEKEKQLSNFETRELQQFIETYQKQQAELTARQKEIEQQRQQIDEEIKSLNQESDQMEEKRSQVQARKAQEQADLAVLKEQFNHLQIQLRGARVQKNEALERQTSLEQQLATLTADFSDHEITEESLASQITELAQQREELQAELVAVKEQRERTQKEIDQLETVLAEKNQQQKQQLTEQSKLEVQKDRAEMLLDHQLSYLQTEYQISFEKAVTDYQPTSDIVSSRTKVAVLKEQIADLGPVNIRSIEQFEQVNERHTFLATQRDDLLSAKNQLFETMEEMDAEVRARFKEVFEAIRQEFKVVFPNMFGGGRAELVLTDPSDLLKTGIEIEVQPPGKKLQSLSLLSGGERALTAIALLFSIIRVCPVPFCILDEVEAALDEANVKRFGRYLSDFQDDTQFIVVTHRKGTMVAADVLYGVTMQESGVSKIVSVRMEDINEEGKMETKV